MITSFLVVLAFITAKSYTQLGIAVALYPLLAYFAFKIFPVTTGAKLETTTNIPAQPQMQPSNNFKTHDSATIDNEAVVVDLDRRAFLKLIGATGLSIFVFSILGRRAETFLFDQARDWRTTLTGGPGRDESGQLQSSLTDGYKISEIDDGYVTYYGFINEKGAWLIMREDPDSSSFRYAKGDIDFPGNWDNRENLNYDYFYNLF